MDGQKMWSQPARSGAATDSQIEAWWKDAVRTGGGYFDTHLLTSESVVQLILRLRDTQRDLNTANARAEAAEEDAANLRHGLGLELDAHARCVNEHVPALAQHRADLDMANARVAVLREGLEMLWRWQGAPDINDETTFSAVEFDRTYGNPEGDGWPAIRALLASPDEAATKLLAWWDAARAWKETYDAYQRAPALSPQLIAEDFARERAFWTTLAATGRAGGRE